MSNIDLVGEYDEFEDIFSKFGALALEKQGNLFKIVGEESSDLDIENGTVSFGDYKFPIQIIAGFNPDENLFFWTWDNEGIGLPEEVIKEAIQIKEFGQEHDIPQYITPMFNTDFKGANIMAMSVCSLFDDDSFCAVNYGDFVFFVTINSDEIVSIEDADEFLSIYYDFFRNFEVDNIDALEYYAKLKGYDYKYRDDFAVVKIADDRVIVGFSDMGSVNSIKVLKA